MDSTFPSNNFGIIGFSTTKISGPNIDLLCVWISDTVPFCENHANLYFDAEHLEKGLQRG